jgi:hypothetical protein
MIKLCKQLNNLNYETIYAIKLQKYGNAVAKGMTDRTFSLQRSFYSID